MGWFILEVFLVILISILLVQVLIVGIESVVVNYYQPRNFKLKPKVLFLFTSWYHNYCSKPNRRLPLFNHPKENDWIKWEKQKGQITKVAFWSGILSYSYYLLFIIYEIVCYCIYHKGIFVMNNLLFLPYIVPFMIICGMGFCMFCIGVIRKNSRANGDDGSI